MAQIITFPRLVLADPSKPQAEKETLTIPDDGEVQLKNGNINPSSVSVVELKTNKEFTPTDSSSLKKETFFLLPEDGVLFFSDKDSGRKVVVSYDWREVAEDAEEETEEESDDDLLDDDDEEEEETSTKSQTKKNEGQWSLESDWFHFEPLAETTTVNNSLKTKLEKGVDLRKGIRVIEVGGDDDSGPEYKVRPGTSKTPSSGEVVYNYQTGMLHWPEGAKGKKFRIEFFLTGKENKKRVQLDSQEEFDRIESFKDKASDLWTQILSHPNPEFVIDTLIPLIESEIDSMHEKASGISSDEKRKEALASIPDITGELIDFEHLLHKVESNPSQDNRDTLRDFVSSEISPKLSGMYSLASLISERIYDLQTQEGDEDFPEFGESGSRVLDLDTLKYMKSVRQEASSLEEDMVDFSKYYTAMLIGAILDPQTYFPGTSLKSFRPIAEVFDKASIGMAELHSVALNEFRKAVLNFDREKRNKEKIPNPVDFRLHGSPLLANVRSALRQVYNQAVSEVKDTVSRAGTKTLTIPENGGRVEIGVTGFRTDNLKVVGPDNKEFTPANANLLPTEEEGRKKSSRVKIVVGPQPGRTSEISVIDPERDVRLEMAEGQSHTTESKNKLKGNKDIFFFAPSSGIIWLDEYYRGKKLRVLTRNSDTQGVSIGKDEYLAFPESGVLEFSPKNGGDKVVISYTQKIKAKRFVTPTITTGDDEEDVSVVDMVADQDADPLSQEMAALSEENVSHTLEVIADILLTQDDPRLDEKDRALLSGILGIGQANNAVLSLQEIGSMEPFSGSESLSDMKRRKKGAVESLMSILREKAKDDVALKRSLLPLKKVLVSKGDTERDKVLLFLRSEDPETDKVQNLLNSILMRISMKPDEENILRWVWGVPGLLRRDHLDDDEVDNLKDSIPAGTKPAYSVGERLQEIAVEEFGADVGDDEVDEKIIDLVSKTYNRAVSKFSNALFSLMEKNDALFKSKYPSFTQFFLQKQESQTLADEMLQIERDEYKVDETKVEEKKKELDKKKEEQELLNKKPLFDQMSTSIPGVDKDLLKSLMQEALDNHVSGKDFSALLDKRERAISALIEKGSSLMEEKTRKRREDLLSVQDAVEKTRSALTGIDADIVSAKKERDKIRERAVEEAGKEYQSRITLSKEKLKALTEILAATKGGGESLSALLGPSGISSLEKGETDESGATRAPLDPFVLSVYKEYAYLADADQEDMIQARELIREDIEEVKETLKELRREAVSFSGKKTRTELRQVNQKIKELESNFTKVKDTLATQEAEAEEKKEYLKNLIEHIQEKVKSKISEHPVSKELETLTKVNDFLSDRDEFQRGDGTYNLDNMFEISKPSKTPGYAPPVLPEGEEDTYRPLQEEIKPVKSIKNPSREQEGKKEAPKARPKKETSVSPERLVVQFTDGTITPEDFLRSIAPHKKNLPDAAVAALDRYYKDMMESDSAAAAVVDAIKQYAKEKAETDGATFAPLSKTAPEVRRSLLEELQAVALPPDPDESKASYDARIRNFKILMLALRNHFKNGGDVRKFSPSLPASNTLSNQSAVIKSVVKFLLENAEDLRKDKGNWDLSDLQKPLRVVPLESLPGGSGFAPVDLSDRAKSAEALHNAQPGLSKDEAEKLNDIIRMVSNGKPLSEIVKGLGRSKSIEGKGVLALATRLGLFINQHSEIKSDEGWNFQSLYTGEHKLPSYEDVKGHFPLDAQLNPLIDSIQKELKDEAGPDEAVESAKDTRERVLDMLHRMSEFAMYDMSLDDMESEFESMDMSKSAPYSYLYLFQKMRNFITRLNKTRPLSKMRNDYGLSSVFGPGAPDAGSPSEQDEVDSVNVERTPISRWSKGFEYFIEEQGLSEAEAETANNILSSVQLRMTESGKTAAELIGALLKSRPDLNEIVVKILRHIGKNKSKYESGVPGIPDLSSLTGVAFKNPYASAEEDLSKAEKDKAKKTVFQDMVEEKELDEFHSNLFADIIRAIKENPGKEGLEKVVNSSEGTDIEGIPSAVAKFLVSKGLVSEDGSPDAKGITLPPLKGRESYVSKDGVPNDAAMAKDLGISEEDLQEEFDDMDDSMPEPGPSFVDVDEFIEDIKETGIDLPEEASDAVEFLSGEDEEQDEPESADRTHLYKVIFEQMANEFDFDDQERANAVFILEKMQELGVDQVLSKLRKAKNPQLEIIAQDIVDYLNENGIPSSEINNVVLPSESDEAEVEVPEPEKMSFSPTFRSEVPDDMLHSVLRAGMRAQKGADLGIVEFIRRLEGIVDRDVAKNAILQGIEEGLVAVQGTEFSGTEEDATFLPVTEDGTPVVSVRVLQLPQAAAPAPAPAGEAATPQTPVMPEPESRPRGRMPKPLATLPVGVERYSFISRAVGLSPSESKQLDQAVGQIQSKTYEDLSSFWKSNRDSLDEDTKNVFQKYVQGLTTYLRLVQEGRDPLTSQPAPKSTEKRPAGDWRNDEATPKQVEKIKTLSEEISSSGETPLVSVGDSPTKGEASDAINALKAQLQQIQEKPAPVAPQAPAPTGPASLTLEKRKQLYDLALKWLTANEVPNANAFTQVLERKGRPDLVSAYTALVPKIQKALDALNADNLDIDLSGL